MHSLRRSDLLAASKVGLLSAAAYSVVILFIAPSAFLHYGDGFLIARRHARTIHRLLNGFLESAVYDIANYRLPPAALEWLVRVTDSIDASGAIYQTVLYLLVGGVFYFLLAFSIACCVRALTGPRVANAA